MGPLPPEASEHLPAFPLPPPSPPGFRGVKGTPDLISLMPSPATKGNTLSKKRGITFERQVRKELSARFDSEFRGATRFHFSDESGGRICELDAALVRPTDVVVCEMKLTHTSAAWFQLRKLYEPVAAAWWKRPVRCLEIAKHVSLGPQFPEAYELLLSWEEFIAWRDDLSAASLAVLIWPKG